MDLVLLVVVIAFFCAGVVSHWAILKLVERKARSLVMSNANKASFEKKIENKERFQEALTKAVLIMKQPDKEQGDKNKELIALALEYPDVAVKLGKELGLDGLKGLV